MDHQQVPFECIGHHHQHHHRLFSENLIVIQIEDLKKKLTFNVSELLLTVFIGSVESASDMTVCLSESTSILAAGSSTEGVLYDIKQFQVRLIVTLHKKIFRKFIETYIL